MDTLPAHSCQSAVTRVSRYAPLVILGMALGLAGFIRFWAAPFSAGPDVPQFWAFAKVFHDYGLDFYRYASGTLDIFPYNGWGFLYPPVWILILGLALFAVPASFATHEVLDTGWRVAMKTPVIFADLAIGLLLYWAVPGSRWRKLLFAALWLFHPTAWYESAVFGQFDAIAAGLLLASVVLLMRGRDKLAFVLAGLAIMTKQHTVLSVAILLIIGSRYMARRRLLTNCLILAGVVALISIPFLVTGNVWPYIRSIALPGSMPEYQEPLVFVFGGTGALISYSHFLFDWDTRFLLFLTIPLAIIAFVIVAILSYFRRITPLQGAMAGFLVFIAFYYRINYQYLVAYIPLALLLAAVTRRRGESILALFIAFLPAVWPWLVSILMWFTAYEPRAAWAKHALDRVGLFDRFVPDYVYVALAVAIMVTSVLFVVLVFTRWYQRSPVSLDLPDGPAE